MVAELAKLAFANMRDYMRAGPDGDPYLDFAALTRDRELQGTVAAMMRDVRRIKFKLADKRAALGDLGRHLGIFKDDLNPQCGG